MTAQGHLSSKYMSLLSKINKAGGVPCEEYPQFFFPEDEPNLMLRDAKTLVAKGLCQTCPIKTDCFEYALETDQRHGIWGGTSPDER